MASSRATQLELDLASQLKELQVSQEDQRQLREREGEITQKLHTSTERPKTIFSFPQKWSANFQVLHAIFMRLL